jgi:solute:Na+ symporter, SSS family
LGKKAGNKKSNLSKPKTTQNSKEPISFTAKRYFSTHKTTQPRMQSLDYLVFFLYFIIVAGYGFWIYRQKKQATVDTKDYFLAEGSLTWWAIGASLIASNISSEQLVGMSGSGFAMGLAIASYEWMAAATLIIVGVFFLPIYLRNKIYTMPQFLTQRYNGTVAMVMAVFWLLVYVFVNLTSILHLGAETIDSLTHVGYYPCIIGLAVFAIFITLGGMKVIGYTDVIQVLVLIVGSIAATYLALNKVSHDIGNTEGVMNGLGILQSQASDHFHMIFSKGQMMMPDGKGGMEDAYAKLPGLAVLLGAMWIANLSYWGCNQYITQRALGADLKTARAGLLFAAFLKMLMPLIIVIPGIAIYLLYSKGHIDPSLILGAHEVKDAAGAVVETKQVVKPDHAYAAILSLLPVGAVGLVFAALTAAVVASLAGKANSIATIFALDIYKKSWGKDATEQQLVNVGRYTIVIAMIIGVIVAPILKSFGQVFQFIQDFTGLISPGVLAIFLMGFFWRGNTANAALAAAIATIPVGIALERIVPDMPFMNRMGWVFMVLIALQFIISMLDSKRNEQQGLDIDTSEFKISGGFALGSVVICGLLAVLYTIYW